MLLIIEFNNQSRVFPWNNSNLKSFINAEYFEIEFAAPEFLKSN